MMLRWIVVFVTLIALLGVSRATQNSDAFSRPIVEKTVKTKSLTYDELQMIYTLRVTRWNDGRKIVVALLPDDSTLQRRFLWEYLGITPARYKEIVNAQVIAGKTRPTVVKTESQMISYVGDTPGAIGFVDNRVYVTVARDVKAINIVSR